MPSHESLAPPRPLSVHRSAYAWGPEDYKRRAPPLPPSDPTERLRWAPPPYPAELLLLLHTCGGFAPLTHLCSCATAPSPPPSPYWLTWHGGDARDLGLARRVGLVAYGLCHGSHARPHGKVLAFRVHHDRRFAPSSLCPSSLAQQGPGVGHGKWISSKCLMKWLRRGRIIYWRKMWLYALCTTNQT